MVSGSADITHAGDYDHVFHFKNTDGRTSLGNDKGLDLAAGSYKLSFSASSFNLASGHVHVYTQLIANGAQISSKFFDIDNQNVSVEAGMEDFVFEFELAEALTGAKISFIDWNTSGSLYLDNISLSFTPSAVPLPGTALLLIPGAAGLVASRIRGSKKK